MEPIGTQINVRLKTVHNGENYYLSVGDVNGVWHVTEAERNDAETNHNADPMLWKELHFNIIGLSSLSFKAVHSSF